jgi:hypothetical protein
VIPLSIKQTLDRTVSRRLRLLVGQTSIRQCWYGPAQRGPPRAVHARLALVGSEADVRGVDDELAMLAFTGEEPRTRWWGLRLVPPYRKWGSSIRQCEMCG